MDTGIIGFFDILGYQSFLENNPTNASHDVISKLVGIEDSLGEEIGKAFSHYATPEKVEELQGMIKWLVFSDTIMIYSPFNDADSPNDRSNRWIIMNFTCMLLWRRMFEFGLPLRGIIHTGEFLVEKNCFAGKAIVEAYQWSQDFDLAGYVYSHEAFEMLTKHANEPDDQLLWCWIPAQIFEYYIPRKKEQGSRYFAANPLSVILHDPINNETNDLKQIIHESFWRHNKDIKESVYLKLHNTEQYLRACRYILNNNSQNFHRMKPRRLKGWETSK